MPICQSSLFHPAAAAAKVWTVSLPPTQKHTNQPPVPDTFKLKVGKNRKKEIERGEQEARGIFSPLPLWLKRKIQEGERRRRRKNKNVIDIAVLSKKIYVQ